jgi:hypothetical protein
MVHGHHHPPCFPYIAPISIPSIAHQVSTPAACALPPRRPSAMIRIAIMLGMLLHVHVRRSSLLLVALKLIQCVADSVFFFLIPSGFFFPGRFFFHPLQRNFTSYFTRFATFLFHLLAFA